ncbi:TonB-dependent siderophore receptor [Pseudomonas jinjuensis]|uniref:Outer-membrane receptor for ferric coprogen and ferric-rhodotorulic acid n=1 Tax=Pseudomonas jinjuensis TaxID=198616 RepID=A0A1H0CB72_9PSED|nr:TonB-dependent siderophore receptor [Pseudomonas jinjuensis]SDN55119.1 outer-membrane receptor for ferric coprogen and ferric-rhodotorulic acid [Pseudomonas jinjuensis]
MPFTPNTRPSRLACAVIAGLLGSAPLLFCTSPALAADAASQQRQYAIPAGSLDQALNRFASESGVLLSVDAALTAGKRSAGLRGSYTVPEALERLLRGSGLQASREVDGSYTLVAAPSAALEMDATTVNGRAARVVSEGTDSYTVAGTATSTRLNLSLRETPQTVSVITRQRIEDQGLDDVTAVLEQTPGLSVQRFDSERVNIWSRGYAIDSFQFDGIPTTLMSGTTATPQSLADTAIYDRVEVLRGASGLLTGAGDPSGTINLVRKRPTDEFQGYVRGGLGSWDLYRTEVDVSGPLVESGKLRGRTVAAYQQNNSYVDHYQQEKQVYYGIIEADLSDSTLLTFGVDYQKYAPRGVSYGSFPIFYSDGTQTDFSRSFNPASRWSYRDQDTVNTFYSLEQGLGHDWTLKLAINQLYSKREFSLASASWGFPDKETGDGVRLFGGDGSGWQKQTGVDLMAQGPFQLFGRQHELVLGYSWSKFDDHNDPDLDDLEGRPVNIFTWDNNTPRPVSEGKLMDNDTLVRQHSVYLASRLKPTDELSVILGGRVSNYKETSSLDFVVPAFQRFSSTTRLRESGEFTPYAGVVYDLTAQHSVYASYTSIFRPQSERDASGSTLAPREGDSYEVGLKSEFFGGLLNTAVAYYETKQDNLAEADPGQTVPGTFGDPAFRAVQGAKTKGFDLEASGELLPGWNLMASYGHSVTKDAEGERINTVAPAEMFKLWTTYRLPGELDRLTVGGGARWQSGIHFTEAPFDLGGITAKARQEQYTVVDLMSRYDFSEQLSATVNVNNLFDKKYLSALDTTFFGGYYGEPRNVLVTGEYRF